ncbi:beta-glucuronidase [hydrothermal vent metagenome]|uniref:Beta-glucuronidase n=1 Tax=hydrothermal vent metagenome TaxID=652676 RepID=A0A3B1C5I0_9ZZZZ
MLKPRLNNHRNLIDISGLWKFKVDRNNKGEEKGWNKGFSEDSEIAVPGSWNEQLDNLDLLHYVGKAWYAKHIFIPKHFEFNRLWIRFDSVDFHSKLWINGILIGENNFGYLPFDFEITEFVECGKENLVILSVDNKLSDNTIPQGINTHYYADEKRPRDETFPAARFDFPPNGGIHRPVYIYTTPKIFIDDISIKTKLTNYDSAKVLLQLSTNETFNGEVEINISKDKTVFSKKFNVNSNNSSLEFDVNNIKLWGLGNPNLYKLTATLFYENEEIDNYTLQFGFREIEVKDNQLLLNGKPVYMQGFGKHEDFPVFGKGFNYQSLVKDFSLMKWMKANSFRTSHYPYAEEVMEMADREGFLVIDEVPAVSLDFRKVNGGTLKSHKEFTKKLIARDKNHPSVIAWALGNEPNLVGNPDYFNGEAEKYWKEVFQIARELDDTRLLTVPNCQKAGINDPVFLFSDFISINRYYGWYEHPGQIEYGVEVLEKEMDEIWNKYHKPIIMTEFGTDTIAGEHSISDQMFTEEYQSKFIEKYIELLRSKDYVIGEHVWNFADFRTPQHFRRVIMNRKGVFTRTREPKLAAFKLKELWSK